MSDIKIDITYVWSTNDNGDLTVGIDVNDNPTTPEFVFDHDTVIDGLYDEFAECETDVESADVADSWTRTAIRLEDLAHAIRTHVEAHR